MIIRTPAILIFRHNLWWRHYLGRSDHLPQNQTTILQDGQYWPLQVQPRWFVAHSLQPSAWLNFSVFITNSLWCIQYNAMLQKQIPAARNPGKDIVARVLARVCLNMMSSLIPLHLFSSLRKSKSSQSLPLSYRTSPLTYYLI